MTDVLERWRDRYSGRTETVDCGHLDCELAREIERLRAALCELIECADLRGDSDLPHPEDDPVMWTSRMQTAWDEARAALAAGEGAGG